MNCSLVSVEVLAQDIRDRCRETPGPLDQGALVAIAIIRHVPLSRMRFAAIYARESGWVS